MPNILQALMADIADREAREHLSRAIARLNLIEAIENTADNIKLGWRGRCNPLSLEEVLRSMAEEVE